MRLKKRSYRRLHNTFCFGLSLNQQIKQFKLVGHGKTVQNASSQPHYIHQLLAAAGWLALKLWFYTSMSEASQLSFHG